MFRILFSAIVLLLFTSAASQAAKPTPGSSCAGYPTNSFTTSGGAQTGGIVYFLLCDGTNWQPIETFSHPSTNIGIGYGVLFTSGGTNNVAIGDLALHNVTGSSSIAIGQSADYNLITGGHEVAIGTQALFSSTYGYNIGIGYGALFNVGGGSNNISIGVNSGQTLTTGTNNIIIGSGSFGGAALDVPATNTSNFLNIGNVIFATGMTGTLAAPAGFVGIDTKTPGAALDVVGDIHYSGLLQDVSDRRAKDHIQPLPSGQLAKLMRLQPVSFVMKADPLHRTELGLIAQDTEPLFPELVQTGPDGMKSMGYVGLVGPMIEAMQEQQAEIDQLRAGLAVVFLGGLFFLWRNRAK